MTTADAQQDNRYRLVSGPDRDAALSVLLTGRRRIDRPTLDRFSAFVNQQGLPTEQLWAAFDEQGPALSALLVPTPGRAGMLFMTPLTGGGGGASGAARHAAAELVQRLCAAQPPETVRLVQALLEPHQAYEQQALTVAGFKKLADLAYMHQRIQPSKTPAPTHVDPLLPEGYTARPWSEPARGLFEAAITASYEKTLDCPGLVGTRPITEVVAGHMAAGEFRPDLWHVILNPDHAPVGALLLAPVPLARSMELVYLGLAPSARGQGIGRQLVRWANRLAATHQVDALTLAVDQANTPAVDLYRAMGFSLTARKLAMMRCLNLEKELLHTEG